MKAPSTRTGSRLLCLALAGSIVTLASPALGRTARIAVLGFQGPAAERVRSAVVTQLANHCEVVSLLEIRRAAASVDRPLGPVELWQVVSRRLGLSAVIKGQVTGGRRWQARLVVNQASTAIAVGSVVISDRRPADLIRAVERTAGPRLIALVRRTQVDGPPVARRPASRRSVAGGGAGLPESMAMAAEGSPEEGPETLGSEGEESFETGALSGDGTRGSPAPMFEASAGPRAIFRTLTYSQNLAGLPGYRLPGAPGLVAEVAFYPAARMTTAGWARHIGVVGAVETSLGANTRGAEGAGLSSTRHLAYRLGVRGIVPASIGSLDATLLLGADYGEQHFALAVPEGTVSPETHYGFLRPSIAARIASGRFSVMVWGGYLHILDVAGLNAPGLFPNATIRAGDAGITLGYAFDRRLQVQLAADYRRYAYSMNNKLDDALLVGGALDEYIGLSGMLTYRFR